jgi:hypothetical protein
MYSHGHGISSVVVNVVISCKTDFIYFQPHVGIFDMDVKNVTGGILIFIVRDRISVTKILNVSHNDNKA